MVRHLLAVRVEASGSSNAFALRPAREDHAVSVRLELPGGFEAQAAVRAGDEGDGPIRFFVDHPTRPTRRFGLSFCSPGLRPTCSAAITVPSPATPSPVASVQQASVEPEPAPPAGSPPPEADS